MSEDKLLSALNGSRLINEKKIMDTESTKSKYYDADEITMPVQAKIDKNIRDIRKEYNDEDKILKDLRFLFDPEKYSI